RRAARPWTHDGRPPRSPQLNFSIRDGQVVFIAHISQQHRQLLFSHRDTEKTLSLCLCGHHGRQFTLYFLSTASFSVTPRPGPVGTGTSPSSSRNRGSTRSST